MGFDPRKSVFYSHPETFIHQKIPKTNCPTLTLPVVLHYSFSLFILHSKMEYRIEKDTMGEVQVPAHVYWGAQTQRSIQNFPIAQDINKMPKEIIKAFAYLKKAAAITNYEAGILPKEKSDLIGEVCDEILTEQLDDQFPLVVWQTGSGTQSNMNCNEVIAYRGHVLQGGDLSDKTKFLHPNDDVNKSQSSNDTFPTAMHIAAYKILVDVTIPGITKLRDTLKAKSEAFRNVVKIGRTHFMDATPLTLGQEFSGYASQLDHGLACYLQYTFPSFRACSGWNCGRYRYQHSRRLFRKCGETYRYFDRLAFYHS